jgi:hypothetical protein
METPQFLSLHNPIAFRKVSASEENKDILSISSMISLNFQPLSLLQG